MKRAEQAEPAVPTEQGGARVANEMITAREQPATRALRVAGFQATKPVLWAAEVATGAVGIPRTPTKCRYISRLWALNIHDIEPGGDWHSAGWFMRRGWFDQGPELYEGRTVPILAQSDIYDARRALRRRGHPQGWRAEPIWAARYARACVDMLAGHVEILAKPIRDGDWWGTEPTARDLVTWTLAGDALRRTFHLVERMAEADAEYADIWQEWATRRRRELRTEYGISA